MTDEYEDVFKGIREFVSGVQEDLIDCPFCGSGGAVIKKVFGAGGGVGYSAVCPCGCTVGVFPTIEETVRRWNTRDRDLPGQDASPESDGKPGGLA